MARIKGTRWNDNDTLTNDQLRPKLVGTDARDLIWGLRGNDILEGNGGRDILRGGRGADRVEGGDGDDRISGQGGDDVLFGDAGNDLLRGGRGDDELDGGIGDDILRGGAGDDLLLGGDGNDRLVGGRGADTLTGGEGGDRFLFSSAASLFSDSAFKVDTITDFTSDDDDKIVLFKSTFGVLRSNSSNALEDDQFATVDTDAAAETSSAAIVYSLSTGGIYYNPNGSDAGFAIQPDGSISDNSAGRFATLEGVPTLSASDFIFA